PGCYEDWIVSEQQRLEEMFFQALRHVIAQLEQAGDLDRALPYALRCVSADRLREEAHRDVMRLYAAAGRTDAALRQYRELERILGEEMQGAPDAETLALFRAIQSGQPAGAPGQGPASALPSKTGQDVLPAFPVVPPGGLPSVRSEQLEPVGGAVPLNS